MESLQQLYTTNEHFSDKLRYYLKNKFIQVKDDVRTTSEDKKENSLFFWEQYIGPQSKKEQVLHLLKRCFPQLCFPISNGINESEHYRDATLKGIMDGIDIGANRLKLCNERDITFSLCNSIAGDIPVLVIPDESDFTKIIQAILYKNSPVVIPSSMGAAFIKGINNWQRIYRLKADFLSNNSTGVWNREFRNNVLPYPARYKDNIIILSRKPYSNVDSMKMGLHKEEWLSLSLKIRLEHECAHLYTFKYYGSASNNLHDELVADYVGIVKSIGKFDKHWMLQFMGLENYPEYRVGARLENYATTIKCDAEDFSALQSLIKNAIENIHDFDVALGPVLSSNDLKARIHALCEIDLRDTGSRGGAKLLIEKYSSEVANSNL